MRTPALSFMMYRLGADLSCACARVDVGRGSDACACMVLSGTIQGGASLGTVKLIAVPVSPSTWVEGNLHGQIVCELPNPQSIAPQTDPVQTPAAGLQQTILV